MNNFTDRLSAVVRIFLVVYVTLTALCTFVQAQQPKKVWRIGYLSNSDPARESARAAAIRQGLRELGHIEGQNISFEYRYADGKPERYSELAADLMRSKPDVVLVAGGSATIQAAKNATTSIPIIMLGPGVDPVEAGLVESLSRPGGNVTGLTNLVTGLGGKRLELLKETLPKLGRVAVLYNSSTTSNMVELKILPDDARPLGLTIEPWDLRASNDAEQGFAGLNKRRPDALYTLTGTGRTSAHQKRVVTFALKNHLPSMYATRDHVDAGGLMYYGADLADSYRRAATYVDKILKGAKPGELPIEQPTKFELVINLKTAKQIGLTIPPSVLYRADRVIK